MNERIKFSKPIKSIYKYMKNNAKGGHAFKRKMSGLIGILWGRHVIGENDVTIQYHNTREINFIS